MDSPRLLNSYYLHGYQTATAGSELYVCNQAVAWNLPLPSSTSWKEHKMTRTWKRSSTKWSPATWWLTLNWSWTNSGTTSSSNRKGYKAHDHKDAFVSPIKRASSMPHVFSNEGFECRLQMPQKRSQPSVKNRTKSGIFVERRDAAGKPGICPIIRTITKLRVLP